MVYPFLSDASTMRFMDVQQRFDIVDILNQKRFTVSDTDITYRQINYLDKDGLLGIDARKNGKGWRNFSIKEVIYLFLIIELKKYGFTQDKLRPICHTMLIATKEETPNKYFFDEAITVCLTGVEVNIVARSDGSIAFFDPGFFAMFQNGYLFRSADELSHIQICLNDLVNKAFEMMNKQPFEVKYSVAISYLDNIRADNANKLSEKELKVVEALRNNDYLSIEVRKQNGELQTMKVDKIEQYLATQTNLTNIIANKDYIDLRLVKRDGKVVHLKTQETVKL